MTIRNMKATNPYSGESEMLSEEEFALYHLIKHAEETECIHGAIVVGICYFKQFSTIPCADTVLIQLRPQ